MTNYDIEMWRYARELKVSSDDPALDFEHLKNKSAVLQNVDIRLNEWGLRGDPVTPAGPGHPQDTFSRRFDDARLGRAGGADGGKAAREEA